MTEFLGLNPKTYGFRWQKEGTEIAEVKKAKGVPFATVAKDMNFESYEEVLQEGNLAKREVTTIGSFNQQLFTFNSPKLLLNAFYDKMKMLNKIDCEPYGYLQDT